MLQQAYVSGFERKTFSALGMPLQPLTLGHISVLAIIENPIVMKEPGASVTLKDLASFVFVCRHARWEEALERVLSGQMTTDVQEHVAEHGVDSDLADTINRVRAYYEYYLATPKHKTPPKAPRVPWWWAYATWLQSELGRNEVQAWGTICSDAFAYYAAYATAQGSCDVMDETERLIDDGVASGKTVKQMFEEGML